MQDDSQSLPRVFCCQVYIFSHVNSEKSRASNPSRGSKARGAPLCRDLVGLHGLFHGTLIGHFHGTQWDLVEFILFQPLQTSVAKKNTVHPGFVRGVCKVMFVQWFPFRGQMIHAWWTFHIYDGLFNLHWSPICFVFLIIRLISTVPLIAGKLPARNWNSHGD